MKESILRLKGIEIVLLGFVFNFCLDYQLLLLGVVLFIAFRTLFIDEILFVWIGNMFTILVTFFFVNIIDGENLSAVIIILTFGIIILALQVLRIYRILFFKEAELLKLGKKKLANIFIRGINFIEKAMRKIRIMIAIIYPIVFMFIIIFIFAAFYRAADDQIIKDSGDRLLHQAEDMQIDNRVYIPEDNDVKAYNMIIKDFYDLWDENYIYFSAVTYFTVGYGDVVPATSVHKGIAILEMIISCVLNIYLFAVVSSSIYEHLRQKKIA